ncbi:alpha/beta fold hydrolase [Nitratireductor sp. GCM10026969]|uniref:alpha/beta fold hydrolase n=1 Tax=Nitratireductor sp. GCM10026969 TaxID=3252645 RepID=UPI00361A3DC4
MTAATETGFLESSGHRIRWERHGNRNGRRWMFVHGGPGGRSMVEHLAFFDLATHDVLLFDQRGCGGSTPRAALEDNSTLATVYDMERLRCRLGWRSLSLLGISWGAWPAAEYARLFPGNVDRFILACPFAPAPAILRLSEDVLFESLEEWPSAISKPRGIGTDQPYADCLVALTSGEPVRVRSTARLFLEIDARMAGTTATDALFERLFDAETVASFILQAHYAANAYFSPMPCNGEAHPAAARGSTLTGTRDIAGMIAADWYRRAGLTARELPGIGHAALHPQMLRAIRRQVA